MPRAGSYLVCISAACERPFIQLPGAHISSMCTRPGTAHFSSMCGRIMWSAFRQHAKDHSYNYLVHISAACEPGRAPHISAACAGELCGPHFGSMRKTIHTTTWCTYQQHVNQAEHRTFQQHVWCICGPHFGSMRKTMSYNYLVHISAACEPGRAPHISAACAGDYVVRISAACEDHVIQLPGAHISSM